MVQWCFQVGGIQHLVVFFPQWQGQERWTATHVDRDSEAQITVTMLANAWSKEMVSASAPKLACPGVQPRDIPATLDFGFGEVQVLLLLLDDLSCTLGFPPFHLSLSEIYQGKRLGKFTQHDFEVCMERYASSEQRHGK